jgi:hypothetical protein
LLVAPVANAVDPGVGGAVFDGDDVFASFDDGAAMELDVVASPSAGPREATVAGAPGAVSAVAMEAAALAGYGEPPETPWVAILYAYRVKTRQVELRRQLDETQRALERVRQGEAEAKLAFAKLARPVVESGARELDPERAEWDGLRKAVEARVREVEVRELALQAYDPDGVRRGLSTLWAGASLLVVLYFVPFVVRAIVMVAAPSYPAAP